MHHKGLIEFGQNRIFYILFFICAALAVVSSLMSHDAEPSLWRWIHYLSKPTATLFLLVAVLTASSLISKSYGICVALGLTFATAGDFFLMLPGDYFLAGLICFFITHCAYIIALCRDARFGENKVVFIFFIVLAISIIAGLWSALPHTLRIPIIIYATAIGIMTAQALSRALSKPYSSPIHYVVWLAAIGGLFFMISDTILAFNRFRIEIPFSGFWILTTYYIAQFLFSRSTEYLKYDQR